MRRLLLCCGVLFGCDDPAPEDSAKVPDGVVRPLDEGVEDGALDSEADGEADEALDAGALDLGPDASPDPVADAGPPPIGPVVEPPACGQTLARGTLIAGPDDPDFDPALAEKAHRFERVFHGISAWGHGANADIYLRDDASRAAVTAFAQTDAWAFDAPSHVAYFAKAAGLYSGVGFAADAYRYLDLRDRGAPCEAVERARAFVRADLELLHTASAITGTPGVIARSLALRALPGEGQRDTVPLFDDDLSPLPAEKDNGTWRADVSGTLPEFIWEDSCSRDMYVGWAVAYGALWEAIAADPAFALDLKVRMREDAAALLDSLMTVHKDGYDLEIRDADGRRTFHGILNENSIDRLYVAGAPNGFNAYMAVGVVAALGHVTAAPRHRAYLSETLIGQRGLLQMARDAMLGVDQGVASNYSAYNMAFTAGWAAIRYLPDAADRALAAEVALAALYDRPGRARQPIEQDQAFYDLMAAVAVSGASAFEIGGDAGPALAKVLRVLNAYPAAPFLGSAVLNCDAAELESLDCVGSDGTPLPLEANGGRGGTRVATVPVPMAIRPPSNYFWRSNPYQVNGADEPLRLMPAVDFRWVYWAGRAVQVQR